MCWEFRSGHVGAIVGVKTSQVWFPRLSALCRGRGVRSARGDRLFKKTFVNLRDLATSCFCGKINVKTGKGGTSRMSVGSQAEGLYPHYLGQ